MANSEVLHILKLKKAGLRVVFKLQPGIHAVLFSTKFTNLQILNFLINLRTACENILGENDFIEVSNQ